ncbi:MAG: CCA tRNA nucleotidyltransferase [Halobacteriaceae archaeon]
MTGAGVADLLEEVREEVTPTDAEREAMEQVAAELMAAARTTIADLPIEADVVQVGSTARGTWISGHRDIDLFVRFPPSLDRDALERYGLTIGRDVLPEGREEYAEHPYVTGQREGFDIDLVPCYRVEEATAIQSAVDRTPFHTEYLDTRLNAELPGEIRVAKQFLTGIGAYGSDLRTRGFSGYLTELLVLEYGDMERFLQAAAEWQPPVELDPAGHGAATFDDPLVVIDPTDPERNVAAVVSAANVARVQHFARELLAEPDPAVFFPRPRTPLSPAGVRAAVHRRDTEPIAVHFDRPDVVDDQLYPQLRRSLSGLVRGLENAGFSVLRADTFAGDERAVLLVEPTVSQLPGVERHEGPPVHVPEHGRAFYEQYADDAVVGPFIDGERYVVERERSMTTAATFVDEQLTDVALGTHVASAIEDDYTLLTGTGIATLAPRFGVPLAEYFDPTPRG